MANSDALETNKWYKLLRLILYALLVMPLLVWSVFLFPFITTKILYFRLLVELAVVVYAVLAVKYPELRIKWNWLTKAVWIYIGVIFVASLFGVNFNHSFWGTIERGEGLVTILHFAAYFTILPAVFQTRRDWHRYLLAAITMTFLNALVGLSQLLDLPILSNIFRGGRIVGTIGNASFFAAVMLFGVFLSLYLLQEAKSKTQRVYLWFVFWFELYILYQTETRGAILAAALAFGLYFLVNVFKSQKRKTKILSLGFLALLLAFGFILYFNRDASWVSRSNTLYRLATISPRDITTQSRLDTWNASYQAFKDRPVFGWGYENYHIAFNKYFPARIFKDQGSQIWFDRAHNVVFDVLVQAGLIGFLAYLVMFAAAFWILFKLWLQKPPDLEPRMILILGVLLAGYFLQNLFVFDTQATYMLSFLLFGNIAFLTNQYLSSSPAKARTGYHPGFVMPTILAVLMFFAALFVNLRPAFANYYTTQGIKAAKVKQYREVLPTFKKALSYGTYMDEEIRQRLVDYASEAVFSGQLSSQEQSEVYQYVMDELRKSIRDFPEDVKNYLYLVSVINRFTGNQQMIDEALSLGQKALALSPTRPQIYFELGQAAFSKKQFEEGLEYFRSAIAQNPEPKESHFNYLLAGIIAKREDIATEELAKLKELGYELTSRDYTNLARAYLEAGDNFKLAESYQKAAELDPQNAELHAKLAVAYGEICDTDNARIQVLETIRLNPVFQQEGQEFLKELETKCKK